MIRNIIAVSIVFCTPFVKGQSLFERSYDVFPLSDKVRAVQQTADGGYMISGYGQYLAFDWNLFLIKTDAGGDTIWVRTYGGPGQDEWGYAGQTSDGGYIITGSYDVGGYPDLWLIKTDPGGTIEWDTIYTGSGWFDGGTRVEETADGGYIVTGHHSWSAANDDVWLIKTDSLGAIQWNKYFGGANREEGMAVQQTTDNGYIITGKTQSFGAGDYDVYLVKTDSAGDTMWTKTYGGTNVDDGWDVRQANDTGYIIAARKDNTAMWILKTDANGDTTWTRTLNTSVAPQIIRTIDGGYAALSSINNGSPTFSDMHLIKMDGSGNILWTRSYSHDSLPGSPETGWAISPTNDGGFILAGETGAPGSDIYLVKTDSLGYIDTITTGINGNRMLTDEVYAFPNPFTNELILERTRRKGEIIIFDVTGKEIMRQKSAEAETKLFTKHLTSGFYFLNYKEKNKSTTIKITKF